VRIKSKKAEQGDLKQNKTKHATWPEMEHIQNYEQGGNPVKDISAVKNKSSTLH
jgi:hypothetical protein